MNDNDKKLQMLYNCEILLDTQNIAHRIFGRVGAQRFFSEDMGNYGNKAKSLPYHQN